MLKILTAGVGVALFYTAVAMAVSSLTTRRAVAAVAIVLVLLVPSIVVGVAIDSSGAATWLAVLAPLEVAVQSWQVLVSQYEQGNVPGNDRPRADIQL